MEFLSRRHLAGSVSANFRLGTSDERTIKEVVELRCYRKKRLDFDVEKGERWLDLGANIGAFVLYCRLRGATSLSFEPDPDNFQVLLENLGDPCEHQAINAAVTHLSGETVAFWSAKEHHRHTVLPMRNMTLHRNKTVVNFSWDRLVPREYDGIKMDIEGSEGGILDTGTMPRCQKLVIEYHTSRDQSSANLRRRLEFLRDTFTVVDVPRDLQAIADSGVDGKTFCDRSIFCKGWKA
jgi:FkbM family methyltransferase